MFFSDELQRLFQEENLAFEFRDGHVQRRGRRHTVDRVSKAQAVLAAERLEAARKHFAKAIRYFRDRIKPDPENAVKEAVCAVEAAAKELFPNAKATTLDQVIKWLAGPNRANFRKQSAKPSPDCTDFEAAATAWPTEDRPGARQQTTSRSTRSPLRRHKSSCWLTWPRRKRTRFRSELRPYRLRTRLRRQQLP
jgi:hypothetical protein